MTTNTNVSNTKKSATHSDFASQWSEARLAYPLYAALATQFNFAPLPHPAGELPPLRPTRDVFDADLKWYDTIDENLRAFQIRQLPPEILNASEEGLRAFLQRQLRKQEKTAADRDKIDLLLVQYFALCAPEDLYRKDIGLERRCAGSATCPRRSGSCAAGMVRAAGSDSGKNRAVPEFAGHDGTWPARTRPIGEGIRGTLVLRSGSADYFLSLQFSCSAEPSFACCMRT